MLFFQGILHFLVYLVLIYFGAHFAEINKVRFSKCAIVAVVSLVFSFLLGGLFGWMTHLILIGWIFGIAIGLLATTLAAKLIFKAAWKSAFTLAMFVAIGSLVLQIIGWLLKFVGGALS